MQRLAAQAKLLNRNVAQLCQPISRPALRLVRPTRVSRSVRVDSYTSGAGTAVKIVIQGRKLPVTESIRRYIEEKVQRAVNHFAHTVKDIHVTLSARGGDTGTKGPKQQKVDVTIFTLRNGVVRVEDVEGDMYASIDLVCDKIERKLRKLKERAIAKGNWGGRAGPHVDVEGQQYQDYLNSVVYETSVTDDKQSAEMQMEAASQEFPPMIVRSKVLTLDAMSVEDAVDQLEQLGHDFFVFLEKQSDTVQVLYKRREAGYGLLIPKRA